MSVSIGRNWIKDGSEDTPQYVIRVCRGGDLIGWLAGDLSLVLELIGDAAHAEAIGEESDDIAVWSLTELGPIACSIKSTRHTGAGFIEHRVYWRDPMARGRVPESRWPGETGYTRILDI